MRRLIRFGVSAVVLGGLVWADGAAKGWVEAQLAQRAGAYYPSSADSSARIHSFPFVGRLAVFGTIPQVDVNLDDLEFGPVVVRRLSLEVSDVEIDRAELLDGQVRLVDIGAGRIVATLDGPSLARGTGVDLRFKPGQVEVHQKIGGVDVVAKGRLTMKGNLVTVTPTSVQGLDVPLSRFAVSYRIPGFEILPCEVDATPVLDAVVLSCQIADVPPALVEAVQSGG